MSGGSEYRRAKRRKADHGIEVVDTMTEKMIGHVSDLSESGMLVILSHSLVSDALYQLRFKLNDASGREHAILVGAHELWADEASAPGQVWTGFRFIDIASQDLAFIRAWVTAPGSEHVL
ncbi:MAG: PilZ domain-containing protein [Arenimonas sp.]